jgi:NAD(P)-dependent dehydrogenase (short-subunit alcohol dehydrogenase family)
MLLAGAGRSNQTIKEMGRRHPLGRVATPEEIARMVRFVAVEGSFMTGSAVVVDGGVLSRLSTE